MKELSLNLLDVTLNSVRAEAQNILVELEETGNLLSFRIADDGCGMDEELLSSVCSPFTTTRTTRKVGLGLPLLQMAAEATGGTLTLSSKDRKNHPENHGTELVAVFHTDHIDCPPLGDFVGTVVLLLQRAPFTPRFVFTHRKNGRAWSLDTDDLHARLGKDIPLSHPEVLSFVSDYLKEQEVLLTDERPTDLSE